MDYDIFFNLHIPKTGGTYFRQNILSPNKDIFLKNNINLPPDGGHGTDTTLHWCWHPNFTQKGSYIYTNFRDPVKRIISHYTWQAYKCVYYNFTEYKYEDINLYNFEKWIDKFYLNLCNFQSKNLVYFNNNEDFYKKAGKLIWDKDSVPTLDHGFFKDDFKNFEIDKNNLSNNLKRINLLVKSENMKSENNQILIANKIFSDLNIKNPIIKIGSEYANQTHFSENLYNSLSESKKEYLYEMSNIDSEIYFSNSLFYDPK